MNVGEEPARRPKQGVARRLRRPQPRREEPRLLGDLDRLMPIPHPATFRVVDLVDPEIDDRPNSEELLPAGIPEMAGRLDRDDPMHQPPASLPQTGCALDLGEPLLDLGKSVDLVAGCCAAAGPDARASSLRHRRPPGVVRCGAANLILNVLPSIFAPRVVASCRT